jgi:hypothetical protein
MVCAVLGLCALSGVSTGVQRGTESISWAQLSRFYLKLNKNRRMDNVQKHNMYLYGNECLGSIKCWEILE